MKLPDVDPCGHVIEYLFEAGPSTGEHYLEPAQLEAWGRLTGVQMDEFEATAVLTLSRTYLGMLRDARDEHCPAPYRFDRPAAAKARIGRGLREALQSAAPQNGKGLRKRENVRN